MFTKTFTFLALLATAAFQPPASAFAEPASEARNRIDFDVERSEEIENDWATAVLSITHEDRDPAALADHINSEMRWALEIAHSAEAVRVRSGGYQTSPIAREDKIVHWRASQQLIAESKDNSVLSELIGKLQARLQLESLGFSVSPERRREAQDRLIEAVLAAFRARGELVRKSLAFSRYEIVHLSINTGGTIPVQPLYAAEARALASADVAPPAFESGTSHVSVHAQGTIELH